MKKLLSIGLVLFSISLFAQQQSTADSILSLIKTADDDSLKAEHYFNLGISYGLEEGLESKINAHTIAFNLFEKFEISDHSIRNLGHLGYAYLAKRDYQSAEKCFKIGVSRAQKSGDLDLEFEATSTYLEAFLNLKSPVKGLETIFKLKKKAEAQDRKDLIFKSYELKSIHYLISGVKFEERKLMADTMLMIAEELQDTALLYIAYFQLGGATLDDSSIDYYLKSLDYYDHSNRYGLSSLYNNISSRMRYMGKNKEALIYADSALKVSQEVGRIEGVAAAYYRQSEAHYFGGNYTASVESAKKALETFRGANILRRQDACAQIISAAYKESGDFENALVYYELYVDLKTEFEEVNEKKDIEFIEQRLLFDMAQKRDSSAIALKTLKLEAAKGTVEKQRMQQYLLFGGIAMILLVAILLLIGFQRKKKANIEIQEQKKIVEQKNQEITDSIQYAKRIQSAILPPDKIVKEYLQDSFVVYLPKDIVAGDFYWLEHKANKILFAAADCTGHGVPGAMVSVVCNNGLNRAVREHGLTDPGKILDKTREIVVEEFEKSEEEVKDGMDIALCSLEGNTLHYAGAHNPLWIIRNGADDIEEIKADKQPIGKSEKPLPYTSHELTLQQGDTIYIFSDGYADQFGGEKGKKMKTGNFKSLLLSMRSESMEKQQQLIREAFDQWKGNLEQLDDVCVIGVRIN